MPLVHIVYSSYTHEPRRWCYDSPDAAPVLPLAPGEALLKVDVQGDPATLHWGDMVSLIAANVLSPTGMPVTQPTMCDVILRGVTLATIPADHRIDVSPVPGAYLQKSYK